MLGRNLYNLPFLGREKELTVLEEAFTSALENEGKCVFINGEPGIGKSRLIDEFLLREKRNCIVIRMKVTPYTLRAREFFIELVREYLRKAHGAVRIITRVIDNNIYDEFAESIPELQTYYPYEAKTRTKKTSKSDINAVLHTFLHNLVKFSPVILIIDDLHESGDDLLSMCRHLTQIIENIPVLCILLTRPHQKIADWNKGISQRVMPKISLNNLQEDELKKLNAFVFKGDIDDNFFSWIHKRTRGVPLFLREFLCTLFEKGIIFFDSDDHKWKVMKTYSQIAIPDSIADMISVRLRSYSRDERTYLFYASILGIEFNPHIPLLKTDQEMLKNCVKSGFITMKKRMCAFAHPLIWEVIYTGIPSDERRRLHQKFGNYFMKHGDDEQAVYQFLKAEVYNKRIVNLLYKLAKKAYDSGDFDRAMYFSEIVYKTAESLMISQKKFVDILFLYARTLYHKGRYNQCIELFELVLKKIKKKQSTMNKETRAAVYTYLSYALVTAGKVDQAMKCVNTGMRFIRKNRVRKSFDMLIDLERSKAYAYKYMGDEKKALTIGKRIYKRIRKSSNIYIRYQVYSILGAIYDGMAQFEEALSFRKKALEAAEQLQNATLVAAMQGNLGICYTNAGDFRKGLKYILEYQAYNKKAGRVRQQITAHTILAYNYHRQGYIKRAEIEYIVGIKKAREQKIYGDLIWLESFYAMLLLLDERFQDAYEYIEKAISLAEKSNMRNMLFELLIDKALLNYSFNDHKKFNSIRKKIQREFRDNLGKGGLMSILDGFYYIINGNLDKGYAEIDQGLQDHVRSKQNFALFQNTFNCARLLERNARTRHQSQIYIKKTLEIAKKMEMNGWIERLSPQAGSQNIQPLKIYCLGRAKVEHPQKGFSEVEEWKRTKLRQLFAIMIVSVLKGEQLDREKIGALLWPELSTSKMANNFRVHLTQLRKIIGNDYIVFRNGKYIMDNIWIDAIEYKKKIREAETMLAQGKVHLAEMQLKEAANIYNGDLLEHFYGTEIDETRTSFSFLHRTTMLKLGDIYLNKMKFSEAINLGKQILSSNPFDEECHRFMMKAYHMSNEKAKALKQYKICEELFKREFDCPPSDKTQEYYRIILKTKS